VHVLVVFAKGWENQLRTFPRLEKKKTAIADRKFYFVLNSKHFIYF
jgi:hypothetical protein